MGINSNGKKRVLGIAGGGSENNVVVKSLLQDLIDPCLNANQPRLHVLDGGKDLHKTVLDTFRKNCDSAVSGS